MLTSVHVNKLYDSAQLACPGLDVIVYYSIRSCTHKTNTVLILQVPWNRVKNLPLQKKIKRILLSKQAMANKFNKPRVNRDGAEQSLRRSPFIYKLLLHLQLSLYNGTTLVILIVYTHTPPLSSSLLFTPEILACIPSLTW